MAMLCEACQSAIQEAFTQNSQRGNDPFWYQMSESAPVHKTNESFIQGVLQGCPLCRYLWRQVKPGERHIPDVENMSRWAVFREEEEGEEEETRSVFFEPAELEYHLDWLVWGETHRIWVSGEPQRALSNDDDGEAQRVTTNFLLLPSVVKEKEEEEPEIPDIKLTASEGGGCTSSNPRLWRHWMQLCTESHGECGDSSGNDAFTPKRLIEVFPNEHTGGALHWKLTTWERPVPQPRPRYLTLSHCWGSSLHTCLLKASLSAFTAVPSPAATLPKTYQDAMSVTDSLGFRYVWIDSLCIIQDDTDDWKTQSAEMGRVYQHTSCNIAAAWAKEGSQGCFSARDPAAAIEPIRTSISIEAGGEVRLLAFDMIQRWKWLSSVVDSPLNQRGWVLQERYMSPRQLTFARDEVFWECRQLAASESHPGGLPPVLFLPEGTDVPLSSKPRLECVDELTLRRNWMELVEKYTASKLTVHTDKLIALAGLAGEARMMFGGDEYLAGMWRRDLHKQLVWYVEEHPHPKEEEEEEGVKASLSTSSQPRAEKAAYLAPSWCWSSVCGGRIKTDATYCNQPGALAVHFVEVLDASVEARHLSSLYDYLSGSLKLRGIAMWAAIENMDVNTHEGTVRARADPIKSLECAKFSKALDMELEFYVFWDEDRLSQGDERAALDAILKGGRSEVVLLFVKATWEYAAGEGSGCGTELRGDVEGLLLVSSDRQSPCARVARFLVRREESTLMIGVLAKRLGIESDAESLIGGFDLGDSRLEDMVQTVTII